MQRGLLGASVAFAGLLVACGSDATPAPTSTGAANNPAASASAGTETLPPGDIPDTVAYPTFTPATAGYVIRIPEGFARADTSSAIVFTFHFNSIRIESVKSPSAPTLASAQSTDVPAIRQSFANTTIGQISSVSRNAGPAVLVKFQADSQPDPVTGKTGRLDMERYEFWHNGTELIVTLAAPAGSDNVDPWLTVTNSLRWQ
ncbi:MAG: hypothetical protein JF886_12165 [Candidatus Dormibacteraeota bacterium]|uniref:Lipoprotein n=1 Tax=Candidatus Aeolococcus gillhamiae TaxID=3127015 RepID=A0A2W5ZFT2_9BACT|nr:hypothetical protein [Candidatus Dormibacteraeota bacterium]PZR81636.1 MAG: hypothetical protein DLM65_05450 [Candidatus Dormibacter sp. RRmetagenome_bin12]